MSSNRQSGSSRVIRLKYPSCDTKITLSALRKLPDSTKKVLVICSIVAELDELNGTLEHRQTNAVLDLVLDVVGGGR